MQQISKKAQKVQSGGPAVSLIGIITLIIILYIVILPPDERKALLDGENFSSSSGHGEILLDESPGHIDFSDKGTFDHPLPNIYLSESKEATTLAQENPFTISKGWFGEQRKTTTFSVPDLDNTKLLMLNFQAPERLGELTITLNGNVIYKNTVQINNPTPIILPKSIITPSNTLVFSVSGGFFSTQRYSLSDVKVIAEVVDPTKQQSLSSFTLSQTEKNNLESAFIDFYPICDQHDVGVLSLELNTHLIHHAVPSCESLNREDLFSEDLKAGKNTLTFKLDQGAYRVEQIKIRTNLKPSKTFIDYFTISANLSRALHDGAANITFHVEFVDDNTLKHAQYNINSHFDVIDQYQPTFESDITQFVREGNNYLEIKPLTELNVVRIRISAE